MYNDTLCRLWWKRILQKNVFRWICLTAPRVPIFFLWNFSSSHILRHDINFPPKRMEISWTLVYVLSNKFSSDSMFKKIIIMDAISSVIFSKRPYCFNIVNEMDISIFATIYDSIKLPSRLFLPLSFFSVTVEEHCQCFLIKFCQMVATPVHRQTPES